MIGYSTMIRAGLLRAAFACCLVCSSAAPGVCDTFVFDKDYTEVRFSWDYVGMTRQSGEIRDVLGRVTFDPARPGETVIDVKLMVSSIETGVGALDRLLTRTSDFFDGVSYPAIMFKSTAVSITSAKTANISGDLTINGIARPVVLSAVLNFHGEHALAKINPSFSGVQALGVSLRGQILRSKWGIERGVPYVSDEIRINIEAQLNRAP